jgi:hypothetical protein
MVPEPSLGLLTYLEARGWSAVTDEQQNVCQLDTGLVSAALSTSLSWSKQACGPRSRRRGAARECEHRPNNRGSRGGRGQSVSQLVDSPRCSGSKM